MSIIKANGAGEQSTGFYNGAVSTSLRFNRASSHYLSRDQGSASSSGRKVFTLSFWVKRGILSVADTALFGVQTDGSNRVYMRWEADNTFKVYFAIGGSGTYDSGTAMVFRDSSAWYHVAVVVNMSGSGNTGKLKIYVNGISQTVSYGGTLPDADTAMNSGAVETLGKKDGGASNYFDGYLADVYLIDGTAVGETSGYLDEFGEVKGGVWIPKNYTGSYGTNGFHLEFTSSAHDAPASEGDADTDNIGADSSGQNHHWTAVDSISADDCAMPDCPENNFATLLGGLAESTDYQSYVGGGTYAEGNLKLTGTSDWSNGKANFEVNSGKWYAEYVVTALHATTHNRFGVYVRPARTYDEYFWMANGSAQLDAGDKSSKVGTYAVGNVLQVALDLENNNIFFGKNNTWENSATESEIEAGTATNAFASGSEVPTGDGHNYGFYNNPHTSSAGVWNFGQEQTFAGYMDSSTVAKTPSNSGAGTADSEGNGRFFYAPPSGFLALCSANLSDDDLPISPAQTTQADNYFGILTWSGDSNATRKIATGESGVTGTVDFTPDWSWIKTRNGGANGNDHLLLDIVRGVDSFNGLTANDGQIEGLTEAGSTWFNFGDINNFETGGFTVQKGPDGSHTLEGINLSSHTYVGWNWKLGGGPSADNSESAGATPTAGSVKIDGSNLGSALAGSIAATRLSANTTAGTSIVTYTGTGSNATVAHGLSSAPDVVMVKRRTGGTGFWSYWGTQFSATTDYIYLNTTDAEDTGGATITNSTLPAATVFSIGTSAFVNASSDTYVAYCFHSVEGYSKFGNYSGISSTDGAFVFTGFRPALVIVKASVGSTGNWVMLDTTRDTDNMATAFLSADDPAAEVTLTPTLDILSNGFKLRRNSAGMNQTGVTYIYMAFAEAPFKYANAR